MIGRITKISFIFLVFFFCFNLSFAELKKADSTGSSTSSNDEVGTYTFSNGDVWVLRNNDEDRLNFYFEARKRKVNERSLSNSGEFDIGSSSEPLKSFKSGKTQVNDILNNPEKFDEKTIALAISNGNRITNSGYKRLYNLIDNEEKKLTSCVGKDCDSIEKRSAELQGKLVRACENDEASCFEAVGEDYLEVKSKNECSDSWVSTICEFFDDSRGINIYENDLRRNIASINSPEYRFQSSEAKKIQSEIDSIKNAYEKCVGENPNSVGNCASIKSDLNSKEKELKGSEIQNKEILVQTVKSLPTSVREKVGGKCDSYSNCRDALDSVNCGEDENCKTDINRAKALLVDSEKSSKVDVGIGTGALVSILQPDPAGISAAQLFGFEADYSKLPTFLRDDFASQLCYGKIYGYLDKDVSGAGSLTRYDIKNTSAEIEVRVDLRAQRTRVTPDKKSTVSYSYYLKPEVDVQMLIAMSYLSDGEIRRTILDERNISSGSISSDYSAVDVPLNGSEFVENSFKIGLIAVDSSNDVYLNLAVPMVNIGTGDYYFSADNEAGNSEGNLNAKSNLGTGGLDSESLLQLLN